jgi:hypothetical protein
MSPDCHSASTKTFAVLPCTLCVEGTGCEISKGDRHTTLYISGGIFVRFTNRPISEAAFAAFAQAGDRGTLDRSDLLADAGGPAPLPQEPRSGLLPRTATTTEKLRAE